MPVYYLNTNPLRTLRGTIDPHCRQQNTTPKLTTTTNAPPTTGRLHPYHEPSTPGRIRNYGPIHVTHPDYEGRPCGALRRIGDPLTTKCAPAALTAGSLSAGRANNDISLGDAHIVLEVK